jgi:uncharacterized delta-60 repeat protein
MPARPSRLPAIVSAAAAFAAALLTTAPPAAAGPGDLDRSFGGDGIVELGADTKLLDVAVHRGKLTVVGQQGRSAGRARLLVARFTASGSPDRSFHRGRPVLGPLGSVGEAVAVQRNGRIVVAGSLTDRSGVASRGMLVMRFRANGSRDRSFGGDGRVTALRAARGQGLALAVSRTGRVLVAGSATMARTGDGFDRVALARFKASGRRDRSFGARGTKQLDLGRLSFARAVAVQRDGRIVIAGTQRNDLQSTAALAARLRPGGSLDRSFGSRGLFLRQFARGAAYSSFEGLRLVRGRKLVLAGSALSGTQGPSALVVRLKRTGRPDRGFGGDGAVYIGASRSPGQYDAGDPAGAGDVIAAGRKLVAAGCHDNFGIHSLAAWGLRSSGRTDRGFGSGGSTITGLGNQSACLSALAHGPKRRLIAAGSRRDIVGGTTTGVIAAYRPPR